MVGVPVPVTTQINVTGTLLRAWVSVARTPEKVWGKSERTEKEVSRRQAEEGGSADQLPLLTAQQPSWKIFPIPTSTTLLCPTHQVVEPWARCILGIESWVGTASSLFLCPSIQIPIPRAHIKDSHVGVQRGSRRFEKKWGAAMLGNSTPLFV